MLSGSAVYGGPGLNYSPWNQFLLWYAICFFIMFFPFLVCDLYYAYQGTTPCVTMDLPGSAINMNLKQWFQVDGYIILGFIIIFLILGIIACCSPQLACVYGWWEGLHVFFILWRLAWLIVGSVLFWAGLNPYTPCGPTGKYMWANLIIGYVWLFVQLVLAFAYPRPVPYPVSIPTATGFGSAGLVNPIGTGISATPVYRPGGIVY